MYCKHKQICNICDASFKMTRGCLLEKRCPACRFLKLKKRNIYDSIIYIPSDIVNKINKIKNGSTTEELGISMNIFNDLTNLSHTVVETISLEDVPRNLEPSYTVQLNDNDRLFPGIKNMLNEQEYKVLILTYKEELSILEVSKQMKLSRTRVNQILSGIIKKLKYPKITNKILNNDFIYIDNRMFGPVNR